MAKTGKKSVVALLSLLMVFAVFFGAGNLIRPETASAFAGGNGTSSNPYLISTAAELDSVRNNLGANIYFKMTNDISLAGYANWEPIGTGDSASTAFKGIFDGNGYAIKNINVNRANQDYQGLFGSIINGTVRNLGIASGSVIGGDRTGGIAGYTDNALIEYCNNKAQIGNQLLQTIVAVKFNGNGHTSGTMTTQLIQLGVTTALAPNSFKRSDPAGGSYIFSGWSVTPGGAKVYGDRAHITLTDDQKLEINLYAVWSYVAPPPPPPPPAPAPNPDPGGVVGVAANNSIIRSCYNEGLVNGEISGGIVGTLMGTSTTNFTTGKPSKVQNCYNVGPILGLIQANPQMPSTAWATGGIVGRVLEGEIMNVFNNGIVGVVSGLEDQLTRVGSIVGNVEGRLAINPEIYYTDNSVSSMKTPKGVNGNVADNAVRLTNEAAMLESNYAFDFKNTWFIKNATHHPLLRDANGDPLPGQEYDVSYTVTFDGGGGTYIGGGAEEQVIYKGQNVTAPPVYQLAGHDFAGWQGDITNIVSNRTITAKWNKIAYKVVFNTNFGFRTGGGELEQDVAFGQAAVAPILKRDNWNFLGWDVSFDYITCNLTVTAQWTQEDYTVHFKKGATDAFWPNGDPMPQYISVGGTIQHPEVSRPGYAFLGWSDAFVIGDGGNELILTAVWGKNPTVTFEWDGGIPIGGGNKSQVIGYGKDAVLPIVTREGYDFLGWDRPYQSLLSDVTITALWQIKTFTVTFNGNGGISVPGGGALTQIIQWGDAATAPVFQREGYTFNGWDNEAAFKLVTANATVTALWQQNEIIVTYNPNGGIIDGSTANWTEKISYGATAPNITPIRTGYTFEGWDISLGNITQNTTLTAQWKFADIDPTVNVNVNQDGSTDLTAGGLLDIPGVTYKYKWYKQTAPGVWTEIEGETGKTINLPPDENYKDYRVIVYVEGADAGSGSKDNGYSSGEGSYYNKDGSKNISNDPVNSRGSGNGLTVSQKIIITIAVIVGVLLLLLIIILVARSISKEKSKQSESNYNNWY